MRFAQLVTLIAAVVLLSPIAIFAKQKDQGKMQLGDTVQIGSAQLKPGDYKVEWYGSGPTVKVEFLRYDKMVATTAGKVIELKHPSPYDDVVLKPTKHGQSQTIDEIDFNNRREALRIEPMMTGKATAIKNR
jgi:hypothetical protein